MSSSIFFRFKSRKDALQISFDGTELSVFEVKREIMSIARLGDGKDFDLEIYTSDTNEIYDDDTTQIPRSTTVIARRLPAGKPGAGKAARYVSGHMPLRAKNSHRVESSNASKNAGAAGGSVMSTAGMTEEEKLAAVMNASNTQLKADLEMSAANPVKRNFNNASKVPDKPLPPGYVCYRCRQKGHWIQACPTNADPNFDGRKPKRTTGIPRSMLQKVDGIDSTKELPQGVFLNADGEYVRVKADDAAWQKYQDQQKASAEKAKETAEDDKELKARGLVCGLDSRPFADPVKTPCCKHTYCRDCIENALLDNDLICPGCGNQLLIDNLETDDETAKKLSEYQAEKKAEQLQKNKEASKSPPQIEDAKSPAANAEVKADSPASNSSKSNSKKRGAEDELENKRRPSNPAEMKKTNSNQGKTSTPIPTGPAAMKKPEPPKNMNDFMNSIGMNGPQNGGMNGGMNGFNPMMGGMPGGMPMMPGMMGPMGMPMNGMMPNFNMMGNGMGGMGFNPNMGMGNGMGWQNQNMNHNMNMNQQQQPWMNGGGNGGPPRNQNGTPTGPSGDGGAYFRQPVNPHRHQNRQRRPRSVDYKQM